MLIVLKIMTWRTLRPDLRCLGIKVCDLKRRRGGEGFKYLVSVRHVSEQYILKRNCGAVTELLNPLDVIVAQTTLC